jgi:hypothetical protein
MEVANKNLTKKILYGFVFGLIVICLLFADSAMAKKSKSKDKGPLFPTGCRVTGFSFNHYVLNLHPHQAGNQQSLYYIHNESNQLIRLYHVQDTEKPYIIHLNNTIKPGQWSAFATADKDVKFICTVIKKNSKKRRIVDCAKKLKVCEYPNVEFAINNYGNYWAVSSNSKKGTTRSIVRQGIFLHW